MVTKNDIIRLFDTILEPKLKWNINILGLLKEVQLDENNLYVEVHLVTDDETEKENFRKNTLEMLSQLFKGEIELNIQKASLGTKGIEGVDKIILVASGKGGVGKSTVSVNLAAALSSQGKKVGLLDADIYGPSLPIMLGAVGVKPAVLEEEYLKPIEINGLKFISIGSLVPKDKAIDFRAQIVSGTIVQFINKTAWDKLDYLVIDMPPGTGDIHLTLASQIKPDGVVVVTTPQEVVWGDVRRSIDLIQKEQINILGIVENMSYTICEECGHKNHPFHSTKDVIEDIEVLARLPLTREISTSADEGLPIVFKDKENDISKEYINLANIIDEKLN